MQNYKIQDLITYGTNYFADSNLVKHRTYEFYHEGDNTWLALPNLMDRRVPFLNQADIVICPGWPGEQNLNEFIKALQDLSFTIFIPILPGIGQTYGGRTIEPKGKFSFEKSLELIIDGVERLLTRDDSRLILGGYCGGSLIAARIAERYSEKIDRVFLINGLFHAQEFFNEGLYSYKEWRGWDAMKRYIIDCHMKGRVPLKGNSEEVFKGFKWLVESDSNIEEIFSKLNIPIAIVHSYYDKIFPYDYCSQYFPEKAVVLPFNASHSLKDPETKINKERDLAALLFKFLSEDGLKTNLFTI